MVDEIKPLEETTPIGVLDKLKIYAVEVLLRKIGPAATSSAIAAIVAFAAAHQGILETWGITCGTWPLTWPAGSEPSGTVILIELDTIGVGTLSAVTAALVALFMASGHHTTAAIKGTPQSGGQRASDQ